MSRPLTLRDVRGGIEHLEEKKIDLQIELQKVEKELQELYQHEDILKEKD